jgi:ABC-type sugar transport system substrate-binding protein
MVLKWRSGALIACLGVLAASGCGDSGDDDRGAQAKQPEKARVAVIMASLDNDFYLAQKAGIEAEASNHPDAEVTVSAGRQRASTEDIIGLIDNAVTKQVDAVAVNGSDTKPLIPALKRVIAAGIPLVLFDAPADELEAQVASYIGTDNRAGGEAGGRWLAEHKPDGGELGVILCVAGHPVTTARFDGFKAGLGDAPFKVVAQADAECDAAKGRKAMEDMITAHPHLDAVFSTSDTQSLGAIKALEAAKEDPLFVSFDAQPPVVEDILQGNAIDASVAWSAKEIGADAVRAAVAAARDEPVEKTTLVPVTVVDKDNAAGWEG